MLDNTIFDNNTFIDFENVAVRVQNQPISNKIRNSKIRNNKLDAKVGDNFDEAFGLRMVYTENCEISGNTSNLTNGQDAVIYQPTSTIFSNVSITKVIRSSNKLLSPSPRNWKTGQVVVFKTTGTPLAGITLDTPYWLCVDSVTSTYLSTSIENAFKGIGVGITDAGTGEHYIEFL